MFPAASGVWTFGPRKLARFEGGCQAACDGASVEEVDLEGCPAPLPLYTLLPGYGCNVTSQPLAPGDLLSLLACHLFSVTAPSRETMSLGN